MKKNYKQIYAIEINIPLKWTHYLKDVSWQLMHDKIGKLYCPFSIKAIE